MGVHTLLANVALAFAEGGGNIISPNGSLVFILVLFLLFVFVMNRLLFRPISRVLDERQVLTLIAAAQAAAPELLEAHLRWLTQPDRRHVLQIAVGALATALMANGVCLALPEQDSPDVCDRLPAIVVS